DLHRRPVWLAGDAHQAADALRQHVVAGARSVGPGLAEAADRAIDQAGMGVLQVGVAEAVAGHVADLEVLDHGVALGDKAPGQRLAGRLRDVDGDRALVAVGGEVVGALGRVLAVLAAEVGRAPFARVVAGAGPLDLDHVGAEVAEELRAGRTGEDARHVEDAQAGERAGPAGGGRGGHDAPVVRGGGARRAAGGGAGPVPAAPPPAQAAPGSHPPGPGFTRPPRA